jgi:hypothetical protein
MFALLAAMIHALLSNICLNIIFGLKSCCYFTLCKTVDFQLWKFLWSYFMLSENFPCSFKSRWNDAWTYIHTHTNKKITVCPSSESKPCQNRCFHFTSLTHLRTVWEKVVRLVTRCNISLACPMLRCQGGWYLLMPVHSVTCALCSGVSL